MACYGRTGAAVIPGHAMMLSRGTASGGSNPAYASIRSKLTSWWEMTEASGNRLDSVGTNHLIQSGTVGTAAGVRGDLAASLSGGANQLAVPSNASIQVPSGGGSHCIFGWYYVTSTAGTQVFFSKWDQSGAYSLEYMARIEAGNAQFINGGKAYRIANASPGATGAWHFFVGWRDAADGLCRVQVDNGAVGVASAASNPAPNSISLYAGRTGSGNALTGRLQRWGWIKGAILTPAERTALYNAGSGVTWAEMNT